METKAMVSINRIFIYIIVCIRWFASIPRYDPDIISTPDHFAAITWTRIA